MIASLLRRVDRWSIARAYATLPSWFRDANGSDLLATHDARMRACVGTVALARCLVRESTSVLLLALRLHYASPTSEARLPMLDTLRQDVGFAIRAFSRRRASSLLVVLTFGLGVGATTAMYSVVDAVLLRPLAVPDPERIVSIYPTYPSWRNNERLVAFWDRGSFTWPAFVGYGAMQRSFSAIGGYTWSRATLVGDAEAEQIDVGLATPSLFTVLGTRPVLGRLFAPDDPADVAMLTYPFWRSRFGADFRVIGRVLTLGTRRVTIIGILPPDFEMTRFWRNPSVIAASVWRPIVPDGSAQYGPGNGFLSVIGRLRPTATIAQASAEAEQLISAAMTRPDLAVKGRVVSRVDDQSAIYRQPLLILIGASALLLVAACTSVAAMLLGAGMDREGELSVRAALGAARGRLIRQLTTEGVLLGLTGGIIGIALSAAILRLLLLLAPASTPGLAGASLNMRVLAVALATSVCFALLFTIIPAIVLSRVRLAGASSATRIARGGRGRLQQTLIVGELVLATVLLFAAALLTRTMRHLESVDPGFKPEGLLTVRVAPASARFRDASHPDREATLESAYYARLANSLLAIPGVQDVAITSVLPFSGDAGSNDIEPEGVVAKPGESMDAERRPVSANYFDVMQMPLAAGRGFTPADDRADAPRVLVVNETLVRKYWPGVSGVGKRLGFWNRQWTVVGVVRDTRESDLRGEQSAKFYVPAQQLGAESGSFVIRVRGDPTTIVSAVRPALSAIDRQLPVTQIATMRERMGETIVEQRYRTRLMLAFSALAAVFAITGVYGMLNRSVARRRHELGIRAALGAARRDVIMLLLEQGATLGALGVSLGLVAGYFGTRVLESMLYDTQRNDPLTIAGIVVMMVTLTLVAAWQPAQRAARVDPMDVLRGD